MRKNTYRAALEEWRPSPVFSERYEISSAGNIRNRLTRRVLKQHLNRKGYPVVTLSYNGTKKTVKTHRMVAIAFIPNPFDLPQVNHKDGNKLNPSISNLEWVTNAENMRHAVAHGLAKRAENSGSPKRPVTAVSVINGAIILQFPSIAEAVNETGANKGNIVSACRGRKKSAAGYLWAYADKKAG